MIKFYSFNEAISYKEKCPLCNQKLQINDRDLATDLGAEFQSGRRKISFFLDQFNRDTVSIDLHTEEVEVIIGDRYNYLDDPSRYSGTVNNPPPSYGGRFLHALTVDCKHCCQYAFRLRIHFDLTPRIHRKSDIRDLSFSRSIEATFLDSETINIEEDDMVHEIKNSYAAKKTYYSYFDKGGSSKKSTLPLIALDLNSPKDTVARIRKLLIFS